MAITRRQFLKRTGAATAGALFGPSFFSNPLLQRAMAATIGDRYFITFFLDGGNDGLNTVVPVSNGTTGTLRSAYEAARNTGTGGLRLTPGDLAASAIADDYLTGTALALHPGFRGIAGNSAGDGGLKALYDAGEVAVIQGCGYPDYSLSHEESRLVWQTANPLYAAGAGWVGRSLTASGYVGTDVPGVNVQSSVAADFLGSSTSVLAISRLEDFGFPYDYDHGEDDLAKRTAFDALHTLTQPPIGQQPALQGVGNSGRITLLSSERYPQLHDDYVGNIFRAQFSTLYGQIARGSARDLREIAKIIYGVERGVPNVSARYFQLSNGGYDTHSDQGGAETGGQHYQLHAEVAASLKVFRDDLRDMGQRLHGDPDHIWNRTTIMVWSEFSRRIEQNENGTDHGSQGPMFVIGGKVNGGVYGNHPNINAAALDPEGNSVYHHTGDDHDSTDFRDVYGTVLKHWINLPAGTVGTLLPTDPGDPTEYWTVADFDLSRPSDGAPLFAP
jgi:uncharacterized protein (DUF1501 family)